MTEDPRYCGSGMSASLHVIARIEHVPLIWKILEHIGRLEALRDHVACGSPGERVAGSILV